MRVSDIGPVASPLGEETLAKEFDFGEQVDVPALGRAAFGRDPDVVARERHRARQAIDHDTLSAELGVT
jgi:hypothetical protein